MTNRLLILISLFILTNCSGDKSADNNATADKNSADTINYLDFKFSKVIAFATVNPFDLNELYGTKKMVISKFGDTISRTLDSSQTKYLVNVLNGKSKKDPPFESADCHNPRHNIAFLDNKDSVLNYVSVCFECRTIISTKQHKGSFNGYEDFFNSIGLKVFDRADYYKQYYDSLNSLRPNRKTNSLKDTVKFIPPTEKTK